MEAIGVCGCDIDPMSMEVRGNIPDSPVVKLFPWATP